MLAEEDTDQRPKPRIWNGDDYYESNADADEKPRPRFMGTYERPQLWFMDADQKSGVKDEMM